MGGFIHDVLGFGLLVAGAANWIAAFAALERTSEILVEAWQIEHRARRCGSLAAATENLRSATAYWAARRHLSAPRRAELEASALSELEELYGDDTGCDEGALHAVPYRQINPALSPAIPNWYYRIEQRE